MSYIDELKQEVSKKLTGFINPDKNVIKKPHNRLWIALIAFNLIFFPLDIATGATVGYITRWYYGLFVFGAGFGTMIIHEALYSNPYAGTWQKVISIVGFITSITITAIIGVGAIIVNVMIAGYDRELYGAVMAGGSFLVLFVHGLLIAIYYFTDSGILAKQKTTSAIAEQEKIFQNFAFSEQLVDRINDLEAKLSTRIDKGDGERITAAMTGISGQDWSVNNPKGNGGQK